MTEIPHDIFVALRKPVRIRHYVDANLFHDMTTGSVTSIIDILNQTGSARNKLQLRWQHMVLNSLQAAHVLREMLTYVHYCDTWVFRYVTNQLCLDLSSPVHQRRMQSFIQGTTPCRFHRVREAIAFRDIGFYHLRSEENPADILSKHWGDMSDWPLLHCLLFCKGDANKMKD